MKNKMHETQKIKEVVRTEEYSVYFVKGSERYILIDALGVLIVDKEFRTVADAITWIEK